MKRVRRHYCACNPSTNKVVVTRDVIFEEARSWNWNSTEPVCPSSDDIFNVVYDDYEHADIGDQPETSAATNSADSAAGNGDAPITPAASHAHAREVTDGAPDDTPGSAGCCALDLVTQVRVEALGEAQQEALPLKAQVARLLGWEAHVVWRLAQKANHVMVKKHQLWLVRPLYVQEKHDQLRLIRPVDTRPARKNLSRQKSEVRQLQRIVLRLRMNRRRGNVRQHQYVFDQWWIYIQRKHFQK